MYLKNISLINFKNYDEAYLEFSEGANAFSGDNGAGKTNLLDAIHYLSLCKSYFNPIDSQQIKQDRDLFMIQGVFDKNNKEELISCGLKKNQKKQFKRNKKEYQRLADHIGLFPLVMISPNDVGLILDGSEERRKFIDSVISQTDSYYLDELIIYNKNLLNRNALLKRIAETGRYDATLLEIFDEQLVKSGTRIFEKRQKFLEIFIPVFNKHYEYLSEGAEEVSLYYDSPLLSGNFENLLKQSLEKDRILQRTTVGIHKDELTFTVHGMPLKKFGSQGQQKSFLIALKLANYSFFFQQKGYKPLLLLDDIFDKLDDKRITKLMKMVSEDDFGQLFITDTNAERLKSVFTKIKVPINLFQIENQLITNEQN
jgi:DNA replication and repair protein RecF